MSLYIVDGVLFIENLKLPNKARVARKRCTQVRRKCVSRLLPYDAFEDGAIFWAL